MLRRIHESECIPPWHGIAWQEYATGARVTAPAPLHWLIAWAIALAAFVRFGNRAVAASPRVAYRAGFRDGADAMRRQLFAQVAPALDRLDQDGDEHDAAARIREAFAAFRPYPGTTSTDRT